MPEYEPYCLGLPPPVRGIRLTVENCPLPLRRTSARPETQPTASEDVSIPGMALKICFPDFGFEPGKHPVLVSSCFTQHFRFDFPSPETTIAA